MKTQIVHEVESYCLCLQLCLQSCLSVLVFKLGCNVSDASQLSSVLRKLWFAVLTRSEIIASIKISRTNYEKMFDESNESVQRNKKLLTLARILPPGLILYVLYLGVNYLRYSVTSRDLIRWTFDGSLPILQLPEYMDLVKILCPSTTVFSINSHTSREFKLKISGEIAFNKIACKLAKRVGLYLPASPIEIIYSRFIEELDLPYQLFSPLFTIHYLVNFMESGAIKSTKFLTYMYEAGILLATVKILFGLDGIPRPSFSNCPQPEAGWETWSLSQTHHKPQNTFSFLRSNKLNTRINTLSIVERYINHCKNQIFSCSKTPLKTKNSPTLNKKRLDFHTCSAYSIASTVTIGTNTIPTVNSQTERLFSTLTNHRLNNKALYDATLNEIALGMDAFIDFEIPMAYKVFLENHLFSRRTFKTFVTNSCQMVSVIYTLGRYLAIEPFLLMDILWSFNIDLHSVKYTIPQI